MVLKYRGYNQNWCFIEAPTFAVARVKLPEHVPSDNFDVMCEQARKAEEHIRNEVGLCEEKITFLIGKDGVQDLIGCTVVVSDKTEPREAFVLNKEAYLMTDNGKTIERIA